MMRVAIAFAAMLVLASGLAAQEKVQRSFPLNSDGAVRIYALTGSVTVRAWERDTITVRGELGAGNRLHAGGGRSGVKMFVDAGDDRQPHESRLEIMVPQRATVWIKAATADVFVTGVTGGVDAYIIGGRIRVSGNPSELNAEAIDGDIEISGTPGWVRAKSASGSVSLRGSSRDVTLSTVTGRILVDGRTAAARFERARFESVTGNIVFTGLVERGGDFRFDSNGGSVDVALRPNSAADVEVSTISGTIRNGLNNARPASGRYGRGSELATSVGDAGARIMVRTFKGAITLRRES